MLSQMHDKFRNNFDSAFAAVGALSAIDIAVGGISNHAIADATSVCSQWPNPCGPSDGQFFDGAFTDNPALAMNVATYQHSANADLTKEIKLVATNTNSGFEPNSYDTQQYLNFFSTDFNKNVTPGGYVWLPALMTPYRSPQIFEEDLSDEELVALVEPIEGSNMTTILVKGTTIENPALGTVAGQSVEILILNVNAVSKLGDTCRSINGWFSSCVCMMTNYSDCTSMSYTNSLSRHSSQPWRSLKQPSFR